jgi:hypothetical protein
MSEFLDNQISNSILELESLLTNMFQSVPNDSINNSRTISQYFGASPALLTLWENYPLVDNDLEYYRVLVTYAKPLFTALLNEGSQDMDYPSHLYLSLVFIQLAFKYFEKLNGLFPELMIYLPNQLFIEEELTKLEWLSS